MFVRTSASGLEAWAPAKLNLFLEVLHKRADGFHELETLMVPIDWFDTLSFQHEPTGQIRLQGEIGLASRNRFDHATDPLPEGTDNIVVRAVDLLKQETGTKHGVAIRLIKRIPMAAGLAGGSSDAAATLLAVNRLWNLGLTIERLGELAASLGSDVPFFLQPGPAVCRGRGERIERLPTLGCLHFVVAVPAARLTTADVFRNCQPAQNLQQVAPIIEALRCGHVAGLQTWQKTNHRLRLHNQLQATAERLAPAVAQLRRWFEQHDVVAHCMSGSGSSYFALCRNAKQARRLARQLRAQGVEHSYAVRTIR